MAYSDLILKFFRGEGKVKDIKNLLRHPEFFTALDKVERHKLLPAMFQIRNEPYEITDYPQFEAIYSRQYAPKMLYKCGRQISKSTNLSRSEVLDAIQIPNFQVLYVAPLQSQANRYSALYLHEAINTCNLAISLQDKNFNWTDELEGPIIKSVAHQAFRNGSGIQMMYAKTSADRARGITADRIDYDEIQDHLIDHIPIISESKTNSEWGLERYTGTAKTTDNTMEHLWLQSTRSEWTVKCEGCNHWNQPTKENNVLRMISIDGVVCSKCGKRLDIRKGELVHAYPDLAAEFLGIHVPQIMVPAIVYNPVKWARLIRKINSSPSNYAIYTEVLGISDDVGVRLITQQDIDKVSVLGTHKQLRRNLNKYTLRVLGIDWGIAEITSFTVVTVLGILPSGEIDVLFGKRYIGQDITDVLKDIIRTYRTYKCNLAAPDFGVGFTNNALLQKAGLAVSQVQYTNQNTFLNFNAKGNVPRWMADRNTALSLVFWAIKFGKIRFPVKSESDVYTKDLLSPYESVTETSSGMVSRKFVRDPARPDDFCHALTFGSIMGLKMLGSPLVNIVPETSIDYTGHEFPESGKGSYEDVTGLLSGV